MKERPILFSAPMVRAVLEGRKTQTRRVIKPQPSAGVRDSVFVHSGLEDGHGRELRCPYGAPGDRLWVRETWAVQRFEPCLPHERDWQELHSPTIRYLADGATQRVQGDRATGVGIYHGPVEKSRPSIHMPRWASRITLEITDVRVHRVQNISEADALAEGINRIDHGREGSYYHAARTEPHPKNWCDPIDAFHELWDAINGMRSFGWNVNPWVWALTFTRVEQPT